MSVRAFPREPAACLSWDLAIGSVLAAPGKALTLWALSPRPSRRRCGQRCGGGAAALCVYTQNLALNWSIVLQCCICE